jgi:hypothetical protein
MQCHRPAAGAILTLLLGLAVFAGAVHAQAGASGAGGAAPAGASVFFPEKTFEFQPVIEGAKVIHDFVVMNKGSAPLVISDVRTG